MSDNILDKLEGGDYTLCPCLLIGKSVNTFKKHFKGSIVRIYSLSDVKNVVEEYSGISGIRDGVLVFDGIGYLSNVGQNSLLKFIEESKIPLIFLSYRDKISPIILSRMKTVYKQWYPVKSLNFSRVQDALKAVEEKKQGNKISESEEVQFLADNCPTLYSIQQQAGDRYDYMNKRMISIMCSKKV